MLEGQRDLKLTEDGDLALDESGDLAIAAENELIEQIANISIQTTNPDWILGAVGADLEDLLGKENSAMTADMGKAKITNGLVNTGFFTEEDIWIEAKPLSHQVIIFLLFIRSLYSDNPLVYRIDLDLTYGSQVRRLS